MNWSLIHRNAANMVTLVRIFLGALVVWYILQESYTLALWLLLLASLTDAVDGMVARRFDLSSTLGACLDASADKLLILVLYGLLWLHGHLPLWFFGFVLFRDVGIVGVVLWSWLRRQDLVIAPFFWGKLSTVLQLVLPALILFVEVDRFQSVLILVFVSGFIAALMVAGETRFALANAMPVAIVTILMVNLFALDIMINVMMGAITVVTIVSGWGYFRRWRYPS